MVFNLKSKVYKNRLDKDKDTYIMPNIKKSVNKIKKDDFIVDNKKSKIKNGGSNA